MTVRVASMLGLLLLLSACAATDGGGPTTTAFTEPTPAPAAFSVAEFAWSKTPGYGRINGKLTYKAGGAAYTCSGAPVVLTPETRWVRARIMVLYRSDNSAVLPADEVRRRTPSERSEDYSSFVRRATCDAAGRFAFTGLPDGSWFVITVARPPAGVAGQETAIMRRVTLRGGQPIDVQL
jgi:hypothetical protein